MICSSCKNQVGKGAKFCRHCGNTIEYTNLHEIVETSSEKSIMVKNKLLPKIILITVFSAVLIAVILILINVGDNEDKTSILSSNTTLPVNTLESLSVDISEPTTILSINLDDSTSPGEITWSSDGMIIAHGDKNNSTVQLWSIDGTLLFELKAENNTYEGGISVQDISWQPSGNIIAVAYDDGIRLWSSDGKLMSHIYQNKRVRVIKWNKSGDKFVAGGDGEINIWNKDGTIFRKIDTGLDISIVADLDWNSNENLIASSFFYPDNNILDSITI